jgi:hypothetical protein
LKAHLGSACRKKRVVLIAARQARERVCIDDGLQGGQTRVELLVRYEVQRIVEALARRGVRGRGRPAAWQRIMRRMGSAGREREDREPGENSK